MINTKQLIKLAENKTLLYDNDDRHSNLQKLIEILRQDVGDSKDYIGQGYLEDRVTKRPRTWKEWFNNDKPFKEVTEIPEDMQEEFPWLRAELPKEIRKQMSRRQVKNSPGLWAEFKESDDEDATTRLQRIRAGLEDPIDDPEGKLRILPSYEPLERGAHESWEPYNYDKQELIRAIRLGYDANFMNEAKKLNPEDPDGYENMLRTLWDKGVNYMDQVDPEFYSKFNDKHDPDYEMDFLIDDKTKKPLFD